MDGKSNRVPDGDGRAGRIALVDVLRGVALVAMAIYHFTWDLEFFGYVAPGLTALGGWKLFARAIASSFLLLAGVSLFLAHGERLRRYAFIKRLAQVAGAALAITLATRFAFPDSFISFGILHQIAFASVVGLAFMHLPFWATLCAAAATIAAGQFVDSPAFDSRWLAWTGLAEHVPRSNDFVPVLPWTGVVLAGIGLAQAVLTPRMRQRLAAIRVPAFLGPLSFAGRHSLAVYLVHQPLLLAVVWTAAHIVAPTAATPEARFVAACKNSCSAVRDDAFCDLYCACALDGLAREGKLEAIFTPTPDAEASALMEKLSVACTAETENVLEGAGQ